MVSFVESNSNDAAAESSSIRLLVCSANLGNAAPDQDSLAAWIPQNGLCHHVIRPDPTYPLAIPKRPFTTTTVLQHSDTTLDDVNDQDASDDDILNADDDPSESDDLPKFNPTNNNNRPKVTIDPEKKQALLRSMLVWARLLNLRMALSQKRKLLDNALPSPSTSALTVTEKQQFDIIVIGMQEATFEEDGAKNNNTTTTTGNNNNNTSSPTSNNNNNLDQPPPTEELYAEGTSNRSSPFKHHNPAKKVLKTGRKGAAAIAGLTATRDYTKQQQQDHSGTLSSHHNTTNNLITTPFTSEHGFGFPRRDWGGGAAVLHGMLDQWLPSYKRAVSYQRGQMRLEVYAKQAQAKTSNDNDSSDDDDDDDDNTNDITVEILGTRAQNTGRGGLANKGGIVTELLVNGTTRLSFLTAHLEAHEGTSKFKKRVVSFAKILDGTKTERWHDVSQTSHFSFAMGDLNFRTDLQDKSLPKEAHKRAIQKMVADENWHGLNQADELHRALNKRACMVGFTTPLCNFPPTFKMVVQKGWDWQNKRRPSYTDRILYKANHDLQSALSPLVYEPVPDFATSDHKPIRAAFDVQLNPTFKLRPRIMRSENIMSSSKKKKSMSLTNLLSSNKKKANGPEAIPVDDVEKVELFVSELSVELYPKKNADKPNPYVALVSTPKEILHRGHKKSLLPRFIGRRHKKHWPQTTCLKGTWDPDWSDEEVKCKIKLHSDDGQPVDLTGALMHLTVLNKQKGPAIEDTVIGSCSFNLVPLLTRCRSQAQHLSTEQERQAQRPAQSAFRGSIAAGRRRLSTMLFSTRLQANHISAANSVDSTEPITTVDVDDFLIKNGKVVGRIQGKIDGWWINQATAKILHQSKQRRATQTLSSQPDSFRTRRSAIVA